MNNLNFRAWHKVNNKMYEVLSLTWEKFEDSNTRELVIDLIIGEGKNDFHSCFEDEVILMQSTGLKDSKGVEIFEGDIIEYSIDRCVVRFGKNIDDESNLEKFYPEYITNGDKNYKVWRYIGEHVTVIGNIYENSEFLEKK